MIAGIRSIRVQIGSTSDTNYIKPGLRLLEQAANQRAVSWDGITIGRIEWNIQFITAFVYSHFITYCATTDVLILAAGPSEPHNILPLENCSVQPETASSALTRMSTSRNLALPDNDGHILVLGLKESNNRPDLPESLRVQPMHSDDVPENLPIFYRTFSEDNFTQACDYAINEVIPFIRLPHGFKRQQWIHKSWLWETIGE